MTDAITLLVAERDDELRDHLIGQVDRCRLRCDDRVTDTYDVFLSHNRRDAEVAEGVARRVQDAGMRPWLDRWCVAAGEDWQEQLAAGLAASASCAVLIGPNQLGELGAAGSQRRARPRRERTGVSCVPRPAARRARSVRCNGLVAVPEHAHMGGLPAGLE